MKRTGKDIYAFVSKNLEEAKDKLAKIGDGYKHSDRLDTECRMLETKINAYEEVLSFISKEPEIVGTTTVDKSFEKLLLDTCPEVKKKLRAFEIIKRFVKDLKTNASMDIICDQNPVNPSVFIACEDIEYDLRCETQEELDLLEEVFK